MAEEMIKKSAQIVSTVIAATTKCSEHKQASVDHSAHMGHGSGHSLHDGMIVSLSKFAFTCFYLFE